MEVQHVWRRVSIYVALVVIGAAAGAGISSAVFKLQPSSLAQAAEPSSLAQTAEFSLSSQRSLPEPGGSPLTLDRAVARNPVVATNGHNGSTVLRVAEGSSHYEWGNLVCQRGTWSGCCCNGTCIASRCGGSLGGTIGCRFLRMGAEPADLAALTDAIAGHAASRNLPYTPLPASVLVVHLRLGDTASTEYDDEEEERKVDGRLQRLPRGVTQIVLTGALTSGNHGDLPINLNHSVEYVRLVTRLYERRGYQVHQRITGVSPKQVDEDIVFMTRAMHFHCDHGTFSALLSQIVDYRGGMVYPTEACLAQCTRTPRRNSTTYRTDTGFRGGRPAGSRIRM